MIAPKSQSGGGKVAYPTFFGKYHLDGHRRQGVVDNGHEVAAQHREAGAGAVEAAIDGQLQIRFRGRTPNQRHQRGRRRRA